jgi:5-methylcytosine-specific restriction endonuclease McrA
MRDTHELKTLPDDELLRRLVNLLRESRCAEADLVAHVGEVDARRLYAREACPSMFSYCTEILHLSEAEAYLRIAAARASREHPVLLEMLADGRLHLTAVAKLAPHLTPENREAVLARATHKTKREVEELVAELAPRPDAAAVMRRLPERRLATPAPALTLDANGANPLSAAASLGLDRAASTESERPAGVPRSRVQLRPDAVPAAGAQRPPDGPAHADIEPRSVEGRAPRPAVVEPLAPARYKVQFTASAELHDKLERLQALMRSSVRGGDLAAVIDAAVTEKLERLESRRFARTRPGSSASAQGSPAAGQASPAASDSSHGTRHIPAAVRRAVYERDGGRCRYVDEQGRRCTARDGLEFHHRHPFGHGGRHSVDGISLLCRAHNLYLAEIDYGREAMARHRRPKTESRSLDLGA